MMDGLARTTVEATAGWFVSPSQRFIFELAVPALSCASCKDERPPPSRASVGPKCDASGGEGAGGGLAATITPSPSRPPPSKISCIKDSSSSSSSRRITLSPSPGTCEQENAEASPGFGAGGDETCQGGDGPPSASPRSNEGEAASSLIGTVSPLWAVSASVSFPPGAFCDAITPSHLPKNVSVRMAEPSSLQSSPSICSHSYQHLWLPTRSPARGEASSFGSLVSGGVSATKGMPVVARGAGMTVQGMAARGGTMMCAEERSGGGRQCVCPPESASLADEPMPPPRPLPAVPGSGDLGKCVSFVIGTEVRAVGEDGVDGGAGKQSFTKAGKAVVEE